MKVLQCSGVPNTAFERQTLPPMYNKENNMGSLYQISGRNAIRPSFRTDRQHSEMQTILQAGLQDFKIAGLQESKRDRLTAGKHTRQISWTYAGLQEYRNDGSPD